MGSDSSSAVFAAVACCVLVVLLPQGIAYMIVAKANAVAECALPSYGLTISPVSWLYWVGATYLISLGVFALCAATLLCSPVVSVLAHSSALWFGRLWKVASVVVTGFVLFRQFNAVCYGTPVWQALLAEFILSLLGFFVTISAKPNDDTERTPISV